MRSLRRLAAALLLLTSSPAAAQVKRPDTTSADRPFQHAPVSGPHVEEQTGDIITHGSRIRPRVPAVAAPQPSRAALELGRRLAVAALEPEIAAQVERLLAELDAEARAATPNAPIAAISRLDPGEAARYTAARTLLVERLGLLYARQFPAEDLRQMAAFFESPAGRRFTAHRGEMTKQIDALLRWPSFRADVGRAICDEQRRAYQAILDQSPHAYLRLSDGRIVRHAGGPNVPHGDPAACRGLGLGGPMPVDAVGLGARLAASGIFDAVFRIAAAAEVERIAEEARGLSGEERRRLREMGMRQAEAARGRLSGQVGALYVRHYSPDQLRAIVGFFESPAGAVYKRSFEALVPDVAWAANFAGFRLPPSLARLAAGAQENWSDIRVPEYRRGAQEASRRLAQVSDFTALILALDTPRPTGQARERAVAALSGRFFAAFEWAEVPIAAELPGDRTGAPALEAFSEFFEGHPGRAYTAGIPRLLPELAALLSTENVAAATRADFCRETRKLCRQ